MGYILFIQVKKVKKKCIDVEIHFYTNIFKLDTQI